MTVFGQNYLVFYLDWFLIFQSRKKTQGIAPNSKLCRSWTCWQIVSDQLDEIENTICTTYADCSEYFTNFVYFFAFFPPLRFPTFSTFSTRVTVLTFCQKSKLWKVNRRVDFLLRVERKNTENETQREFHFWWVNLKILGIYRILMGFDGIS